MEISQELETAATLASENRVIPRGLLVFEADTGKAKLGTGGARWNSLPYWQPDGGAAAAAAQSDVNDVRDEPIWLPANVFALASGSAATAAAGGAWRVFSLDSTSVESICAGFVIPSWWATVDVTVVWANASTGTGDVRWGVALESVAAGGNISTASTPTEVNSTALGQHLRVDTQVLDGVAVNPALLYNVRVRREADDAADTLANDANVIGVLIARAS